MNEKHFTQSNRTQFAMVSSAAHDRRTFRDPDSQATRQSFLSSLTRMTRFFQRCWIAACYMHRLNYSRRLAWAKAAR